MSRTSTFDEVGGVVTRGGYADTVSSSCALGTLSRQSLERRLARNVGLWENI
jgi:hypothetical protein